MPRSSFAYFLGVVLLVGVRLGFAANCTESTLERDQSMANDLSAGKLERLERMKLIYQDVRELKGLIAQPKEMPASFYKRCFDQKVKAFSLHARNAHESLSDRADFHALLGDYLVLMGNRSDALASFDTASQQDPNNAEYKLRAFELFQDIEANRIKALPTKADRLRATEDFKKKILTRVQAVLDTPGVSAPTRSQANVFKALAYATSNRFAEAEKSWLDALKDMPSNAAALAQLSKFYVTKLNRPDKALPHLRRLSQERPSEETFKDWIDASYLAKDPQELLTATNASLEKYPKQASFKIYKAWALLHFDRFSEARALTKSFSKKEQNLPVAKEVIAKLNAVEAKSVAASSPGQALSLLKESIRLMPNEEEYRIQLAQVIVDHARAKNFSAKEAVKGDFDYAISTMSQVLVKRELSSQVADLGLTLFAFSSQPAAGRGLCEKLYPDRINTPDNLIHCAYIYKASGQDTKAQGLLDRGLQNPDMKPHRERFMRAMSAIGL